MARWLELRYNPPFLSTPANPNAADSCEADGPIF